MYATLPRAYQESISKSTVKYNKALGHSAFYDQKSKPRTLITIPRTEIRSLINMHEIDVVLFLLISISTRRYMSVSTGNIYIKLFY